MNKSFKIEFGTNDIDKTTNKDKIRMLKVSIIEWYDSNKEKR